MATRKLEAEILDGHGQIKPTERLCKIWDGATYSWIYYITQEFKDCLTGFHTFNFFETETTNIYKMKAAMCTFQIAADTLTKALETHGCRVTDHTTKPIGIQRAISSSGAYSGSGSMRYDRNRKVIDPMPKKTGLSLDGVAPLTDYDRMTPEEKTNKRRDDIMRNMFN